jgi:uncharacterized protein (DUF433 family)
MSTTRAAKKEFYGGEDPRHLPLYTVGEAARYLHLAPATLRSWVVGRSYPRKTGHGFFAPLIQKPTAEDPRLSFANLIEAHVLRALRTQHAVSIQAVRTALDYAERPLGIQRLLIRPELQTNAGDLFLEKYGELINLSKSGQYAMKRLLESYLQRVEWDRAETPVRLFPFVLGNALEGRPIIAIDPFISFGRPIIISKGISTAMIAQRVDLGESLADIALDYGLEEREVEAALLYERAA